MKNRILNTLSPAVNELTCSNLLSNYRSAETRMVVESLLDYWRKREQLSKKNAFSPEPTLSQFAMSLPTGGLKCVLPLFFFLTFTFITFNCLLPTTAFSQNIGINSTGIAPNISAGLDVDFTNKGLLIPRVSLTNTTDVATIATPATSLVVYNTNAAMTGGGVGYWYWNSAIWVRLSGGTGGNDWGLLGNAGTSAGINFLGTTDAQPLVFRANNTEWMRILSGGNVGIGTTTPAYRLDLNTGTFAFGSGNVRTESRDDAGLQGNAGAQSGFFETASPTNYPAGASSWWHLIDSRHSNNTNNYALQIAGSFFDQRLWFRKTNSSATQAWTEVVTVPYGMPQGGIIMWSGTLVTIPTGWALCDGTNGTPDLRDRFILSVSAAENPGAIGGAHFYSLTTAELPSHNHSGTTSSDGNHTHTGSTSNTQLQIMRESGSSCCGAWDPGNGGGWTTSGLLFNTTGNSDHTHSFTTAAAGLHTHTITTSSVGSGVAIDNRPAFFKLAYIMKL